MVRLKRIYRKSLAIFALFSLELIVVWVLFISATIIFFAIWRKFIVRQEEALDQKIFSVLEAYISPGTTILVKIITYFANFQFLSTICTILLIYFLFIKKHRWYSIKIPVVAIGSITLNLILKYIFSRQRPLWPLDEATGFSFPSGHAMSAFSFYGLLIYIVWREVENKVFRYGICIFLLLFILLIGFSRIYLRVHFTSDVIAGFCIGFIWLIISIAVLRKLEKYSYKKLDSAAI